jgi:hypothetical protein
MKPKIFIPPSILNLLSLNKCFKKHAVGQYAFYLYKSTTYVISYTFTLERH